MYVRAMYSTHAFTLVLGIILNSYAMCAVQFLPQSRLKLNRFDNCAPSVFKFHFHKSQVIGYFHVSASHFAACYHFPIQI